MSFIWPGALILLLAVPVLVVLYVRMQRQRQLEAARFAGLLGATQTAGRSRNVRRYVPHGLFLLAIVILALALARPQAVLSLPRQEGTVILAFDVSGSMAADDLKPTRMDAAKSAARAFVQRQPPAVQVGVVAFSDSGFAMQAATTDKDAVLASIDRMTPQRGTSIAHGIIAALSAIDTANGILPRPAGTPTPTPVPVPPGTYKSAAVVLLTDGENNEQPDPLAAAQTAAQRGVRIYTVGIGSAQGTLLHVNGFTVHTKLDEATLRQISELTGGSYYNADNEQDLSTIFDNLDPQLVLKAEKTELTSILAGLSMAAMICGGALSLLWFNRVP